MMDTKHSERDEEQAEIIFCAVTAQANSGGCAGLYGLGARRILCGGGSDYIPENRRNYLVIS